MVKAKKRGKKSKKGNEVLRNYLYAGIVVAIALTVINSTGILSENTISGNAGKDVIRPVVTSDIIPISCLDSDGGINANTYGSLITTFQMANGNVVTRDADDGYGDKCSGTKKVIETYCVGNAFASVDIECDGTCTNGACDSTTPTTRTEYFARP